MAALPARHRQRRALLVAGRHDQRSQVATGTGSISASDTALRMLSTISHGETKVTHCTRRARISADSVSRPR